MSELLTTCGWGARATDGHGLECSLVGGFPAYGGEARARMRDDGGEGGMSAEAQHVEVGEIGGEAESDRSVWGAWSTCNGDGKRRGGG